MTYLGHVRNGVITLDDPVPLPEGAVVVINLATEPAPADAELADVFLRHAGKGDGLPADLAANHDHYAHGKPSS